MDATKLSNQRRIVEKFLTQSEKEDIKGEFNQQKNLDQSTVEEVHEDVMDEVEGTEEVVFNEEESKMKDELTVLFTKVKNEERDERIRPNTFPMHNENRDKLKSMNKILTSFIKEEVDIGIDELNSLHYSAAVILSGKQKSYNKNPRKEKPDPDRMIHLQIEKVRKWIGRLTMANRNGVLNPKIKSILKGQPIQTKLQNLKMKLAALKKQLRTRKSNRERY